ncbi:MAG: DinB family protein [Flavobacteriales bacterium]|nr:DinB family protein [Flavobacteriales bacterium]
MDKTDLLKLLDVTKDETKNFFDLTNEKLSKSYGQGKWNIRQILHHLTDTEILFYGRLKKIIAEPKQVIWAFNQDDWNMAFNYHSVDLGNKKVIYELCRNLNYELIDQYYDNFWNKEFVHNETGLRTLKDEFEKVALHNQGHINQIKIALEQ